MATPLVATKLYAPKPRRGLVARPRLSARLSRDGDATLTLISAPAGFGKTTLLAEWLAVVAEDERAVAWLSLDHNDNEPATFWRYVATAVDGAAPGCGESALALLESGQAPIQTVLTALVNELSGSAGDVRLVLDDYHVIESADIHEAMEFFLEHLPRNVGLVIASRADPPLPLARWRARRDLVEIRAADLRFTTEEAAAYFNDSMGLGLDADDVGVLETRTEGWIAALQLAALSLQGREDAAEFIASFAGDDRFVVDYLVEEVLEHQPEDVRRFLLHTAILRRLTGSLCDAVTGDGNGAATLEVLDRDNLFVVPLDDRRLWYRYHHLFGDVLRARLLGEDPDGVRELHRRASAWFEANGEPTEAIAHALSGEDFPRAAELIELAVPQVRVARQEMTLRRWLEALPDELFGPRPVLSIALVGARMATGDATGVAPLLSSVEKWLETPAERPIVFDEDEYSRLPEQVAVYRAGLALLAADIPATMHHASRALALADPSDNYRVGAASALLGLAHWTLGELKEARRRYADTVERFVQGGYLADVLGVCLGLADIQMAQGSLRDAQQTFEFGLTHAAQRPGMRGTADMHVGLSEVLLEANDLEQARRHLEASRELGEHAGLPQNAYRWRVANARVLEAQGDLSGAFAFLDEAEPLYDTDFSPAIRPVAALKARVWLKQGDVAAAERWAGGRNLAADDELTYVREFEHITLARVLLARGTNGSADAVTGLLERLLRSAEAGGRGGSVVEILVLQSLALQKHGEPAAAAAALEQALARAEPEGFVRVFVDEGPAMTALLRTNSFSEAAGRHAQRVLAAAHAGGPAPAPRTGLVEELSSRELDVLRLLRSDLSGPDIARELTVSLNTMRTHTKHIFTKLGVSNRREAVRRAAELGL